MILIDDELFEPDVRVKIVDDVDGIFGKNHLIIFTIDEKGWNMASLDYLGYLDFEGIEFMLFEVLFEDIDPKLNEEFWQVHGLFCEITCDILEGRKGGIDDLKDHIGIIGVGGVEKASNGSHRPAPQNYFIVPHLFQFVDHVLYIEEVLLISWYYLEP